MRWTLWVLLVAAAVTAGCESGQGQLFQRTIPAPSLRGNLIGEPAEQPIAVYLPPRYGSGAERYPVVYLLPGYDTPVFAYLDGTFQGFSLVDSMDRLIAEGKIEAMIVVVVNGRNVLGGSFFANSPVTGSWERFLVRDVVRYVDRHYKTLPFRETRGITGHASGATAALDVALRYPDVFSVVYAMSPQLFDSTGAGLRAVLGKPDVVRSLAQKQKALSGMTREIARTAFLSYIDSLFIDGTQADLDRTFVCAYGAAFSPDTASNAPYVAFPVGPHGGPGASNTSVIHNWLSGFGDVDGRIRAYLDEPVQLDAIVVEAGTQEPAAWIVNGCHYLSSRLDEAGVPHEMVFFDGGRSDHLRERIEAHMLPSFSAEFENKP
jgi:S-formylglutathione hydrolase